MKKTLYICCAAGMLSLTGCLDELNQMPHQQTTSQDVYTSVENYKAVLAKLYASFVITGQEKGDGNPDLSSNSGYDYMRCYFNLQESGTEEIASTWLEGDKVEGLTYLSWDSNDPWVSDMYYRIYYTVALCNEFLRNSTEDKISRFSDSEREIIREFVAEARFLRALAYYHVLDLYGKGPFVDENDPVGAFIPPAYNGIQLFDYIESELKDVEEGMNSRASNEYGRAPRGAAWSLLAKLYLNGSVYTGKSYYSECIAYCNKVIAEGYSLEENYPLLFNADNHKRTNEIIFPLCVDSEYTVSWGSTTYIVCGAVSSTSDYMVPGDYGVTSGWGMFRVRGEVPALFSDEDKRGMFFTEGQTQYLDKVDNQANGYFVTKWTNLTDAGEMASNTGADGVNTDYPMFRLADIYLMLAESVLRGGSGASGTDALEYVNRLRERAFGSTDGNIAQGQMTLDFILDERCRELYWECTRRTDLIRYSRFTSGSYVWQWKGGVKDGKGVASKYNIYPIPASELSANPNLSNEYY